MIHASHEVIIFTDGAARGNPGPGGYAAIIVLQNNDSGSSKLEFRSLKNIHITEIGGGEVHTTNNRMELRAAIEALSFISKSQNLKISKLTVYTDSSYLANGITRWIHGWQKKGWKTANKKPVLNQDLWEQLLRYSTIYRTITWKQIAGHADTAGNIRADEIATAFADGENPKLYSGVLKNYRIKNILNVS